MTREIVWLFQLLQDREDQQLYMPGVSSSLFSGGSEFRKWARVTKNSLKALL